jgi:hypothetical protein
MVTGRDILRSGIKRTDKILELGPGYNPLTPKVEGWHSYAIDHTDRDGLIAKWRDVPSVSASAIEPVDFVWTTGVLNDAIPAEHHGTFDVFVASHVLEHVPDLVGLLRSVEVLCRPDAKMIVVLPDKRVCFDFFRPLSTTGALLAAHWDGRSRHSAKTLWDFFAYTAMKGGNPAWTRADQSPLAFAYSLNDAYANATKPHDEYVDVHAWTFVPASFSLIMLELAQLGLSDWQIKSTKAAEHTEFYVWLQRGALARRASIRQTDVAAERMRLLNEVMLELFDQGRQLPAGQQTTVHELNAARLQVAQIQEDLTTARNTIDTIRSSRVWRARSRLRKILGLSAT